MSTLATLRSDLRTQLKIDTQKNIWSDATLNDYINNAYSRVQRDGDYDWQETMGGNQLTTAVSGTQEYSLPTDNARIDLVQYNGNELFYTTKVATKRKDGNNISASTPSNYYIESGIIGLWPVPNSSLVLDLDYRKRLTTLSSDSDTIDFNDDYDQAIINYAAYLAWNGYRGSEEKGQFELAAYQLELDRLLQTYILFAQENLKFNTQIASAGAFNTFTNNSQQ